MATSSKNNRASNMLPFLATTIIRRRETYEDLMLLDVV